MITVRKNPNFPQFIQVLSFGKLFQEIQGQAKALRIAKKQAKELDLNQIEFLGKLIDINK